MWILLKNPPDNQEHLLKLARNEKPARPEEKYINAVKQLYISAVSTFYTS